MGTSIECYFAHGTDWHPASLERKLNQLCATFATDVEAVQNAGGFSSIGKHKTWYVTQGAKQPEDPDYLFGEGPAGLAIYVYRRVMCLSSCERFSALYPDSLWIVESLRRLICSFTASLEQPVAIAVAAGGMGDTDQAEVVAYNERGSFEEVCRALRQAAGEPTGDWNQLREAHWYLGPAAVK